MSIDNRQYPKVYSGTYTNEGHDVGFHVDEDGVTVVETFNGTPTVPRDTSLLEALDYQTRLTKLGYTTY